MTGKRHTTRGTHAARRTAMTKTTGTTTVATQAATATAAPTSTEQATAGGLWDGVLQAEMRAVAATLAQWQGEAGLTQVAAATRVRDLQPETLRKAGKGLSHAHLSRLLQTPNVTQTVRFGVIRTLVEALGHNLRDLVDTMDTARQDYLTAAMGYDAPAVVAQAEERRRQEQRLTADFRVLDSSARDVVLTQVASLARVARRRDAANVGANVGAYGAMNGAMEDTTPTLPRVAVVRPTTGTAPATFAAHVPAVDDGLHDPDTALAAAMDALRRRVSATGGTGGKTTPATPDDMPRRRRVSAG